MVNICLINSCDVYNYICNYTIEDKTHIYHKECYNKDTLNCNFDYKGHDVIGKMVKIGLTSSSIPIVICLMIFLSILLMIILLICVYDLDRKLNL